MCSHRHGFKQKHNNLLLVTLPENHIFKSFNKLGKVSVNGLDKVD